jgi:hypothetical protein
MKGTETRRAGLTGGGANEAAGKVSVQLQPPPDKLAEEIQELGGEPPARIA